MPGSESHRLEAPSLSWRTEYRPEDYAAERDPQLEQAMGEALQGLAAHPASQPPEEARPMKAVPPLPPRG